LEIHGIDLSTRLPFAAVNANNTVFAVRSIMRGAPYITHVNNESGVCSGGTCMRAVIQCEHLAAVKDEPRNQNASIPIAPLVPLVYLDSAVFLSVTEIEFIKRFIVSSVFSKLCGVLIYCRVNAWMLVFMYWWRSRTSLLMRL